MIQKRITKILLIIFNLSLFALLMTGYYYGELDAFALILVYSAAYLAGIFTNMIVNKLIK